jgi:hypothetical protein
VQREDGHRVTDEELKKQKKEFEPKIALSPRFVAFPLSPRLISEVH